MMNNPIKPPKIALKLFRWFIHPDYQEDIEGDLEQKFNHSLKSNSPRRAKWNYTIEVVKLMRPTLIKPIGIASSFNPFQMLRNNILLTFRLFKREKFFTGLNIIGLACGVWCAILAGLWVDDELSFDRFHANEDQLFRLLVNLNLEGEIITEEGTAFPTGDALVEEFPEVMDRVRYSYPEPVALSVNENFAENELAATDPNFFETFSIPLSQGDSRTCLTQINSIVVSRSFSDNLFPEKDPIGEIVTVYEGEYALEFLVTGVFEDFPRNSSINFDLVIPIDNLKQLYGEMDNWGNTWFATFLLTNGPVDTDLLNQKIKNVPKAKGDIDSYTLMAQPYADQYLYNRFENGALAGGRIDYIRLFTIIAIITVLIACFNYVNLTTARSIKRTREIGIRKIIGAYRRNLIAQLMTESIILVLVALVVGIVLVQLTLPQFNAITAKELQLDFTDTRLYGLVASILVFTIFFSGLYPSLLLSSFSPINALKGVSLKKSAQVFVSKFIVVFQYTMTVVLATGTFIVYSQLNYIINKDLGLDRENIAYLELDQQSTPDYQAIKTALEAHSGISAVSGSSHDFIGPAIGFTTDPIWRGKEESTDEIKIFGIHDVDFGLLEMLDIKFLKGRSFTDQLPVDSTHFIINKSAAESMGFEDPIGESLTFWGKRGKIIGLVEDFHFATLHEPIRPVILRKIPNEKYVFFKIAPDRMADVMSYVEEVYEEFSQLPVKYHFLDMVVEESYQEENGLKQLAGYFSVLAIIISCLGLLGMATYTVTQKIKQIAIRKVLGARMMQLAKVLFSEFLVLIALGIIIGVPISHFWSQQWLENFAYRIEVNVLLYSIPCLAVLILAIAPISQLLFKISRINPSTTLRDE